MAKYRYLKDLTSDVMFEAFGKDEGELLENAAEAVFGVVAKIDKVGHNQKLELEFGGDDLRNTLYHFLNNLLAEAEIAEMFLSKFKVEVKKEKGGYKGKVAAWGEPISPEKGETVVKAVTLYKLSAEKIKEGFRAVVVCDI